jgi:hypothetical protein
VRRPAEKRERAQQPIDTHARLETAHGEENGPRSLERRAVPGGGLAVAGREPLGVDEPGHGADPAGVELVVLFEEGAAEVAEDEDAVRRCDRVPLEQVERRRERSTSRAS